LGAMICLPKNPRCLLCPVMNTCKARANGTQSLRPVKKPKKDVPQYIHAAGVFIKHGRVLLAQRPSKGLLGGMWEFPNGRVDATRDPAKELVKVLKSGYSLQLRVKRKVQIGVFHHGYTHFKVIVHAFACDPFSVSTVENFKWVALKDLNDYPMGRIDRQIANAIER
jgi:A/G-specific adenine glycosylase